MSNKFCNSHLLFNTTQHCNAIQWSPSAMDADLRVFPGFMQRLHQLLTLSARVFANFQTIPPMIVSEYLQTRATVEFATCAVAACFPREPSCAVQVRWVAAGRCVLEWAYWLGNYWVGNADLAPRPRDDGRGGRASLLNCISHVAQVKMLLLFIKIDMRVNLAYAVLE
jgi:hypothetical protein